MFCPFHQQLFWWVYFCIRWNSLQCDHTKYMAICVNIAAKLKALDWMAYSSVAKIPMMDCWCSFLSERTSSYTKKSGDMFEVFFELPPDSCNIRLSLEKENHYTQHRIVTRGRLDSGMFHQDCSGYELRRPCGLVFDYIETSCTGTFTFKDGNGSVALVADLTVEGKWIVTWSSDVLHCSQ